ncbi:MAG: class III poly(R)-hydroxyalkanoic acid synthase subunit PhaC [Pseudomonadota bacterium]
MTDENMKKFEEMMDPFKTAGDLLIAKAAGDSAKMYNRLCQAREILMGPLETGIAMTPYDVEYEEDRVKLKHYRPMVETCYRFPLLVIYAQVNRETMLDLQPGKSVVETLLKAGIDVYMIDWGYPTRKDRYLTLGDHINGYIDNIVDYILEKHNLPQLHLMGICMGGTFCVIYTALHAAKVKNLITTVTPTNFDTKDGLLNVWAAAVNPETMVEAYGNIPGDVMNIAFLLLNPARLMIDKYVGFLENIDNKEFVENFIRMEKWIFDSPDLPGETFREFFNITYRDNLLIQNKLKIDGKPVDLKKIVVPVLNIYAKYDHLVPPSACELLTKNIGSADTEDLCLDTGHIGIYVSSKTQREFAPKIIGWLAERDQPATGSKKPKAATGKAIKKKAEKKAPPNERIK